MTFEDQNEDEENIDYLNFKIASSKKRNIEEEDGINIIDNLDILGAQRTDEEYAKIKVLNDDDLATRFVYLIK